MSDILLFDDVPKNQHDIATAFGELGSAFSLEEFDASKELPEGSSYERHIEQQLMTYTESSQIAMVACDKELGAYVNYRGLSSNAVSAVCRNLGIPFCQYSRNFSSALELARFEKLQRWDSEEITLEGDTTEKWAAEIAGLAHGFDLIRQRYASEGKPGRKSSAGDHLARILDRPDLKNLLELYGSGDQSVMTEIFAFAKANTEQRIPERMSRVLGNWLWLSIMRFPGILVNETAAASFLNVSTADFSNADIWSKFDCAKYDGPYSNLGNWWWRDDLESLLLDNAIDDGLEYLKGLGVEVAPCLDSQTKEAAGYYCMITNEPVSRENSVGDINWFPSGANLARIRQDKFDEITSLVSI